MEQKPSAPPDYDPSCPGGRGQPDFASLQERQAIKVCYSFPHITVLVSFLVSSYCYMMLLLQLLLQEEEDSSWRWIVIVCLFVISAFAVARVYRRRVGRPFAVNTIEDEGQQEVGPIPFVSRCRHLLNMTVPSQPSVPLEPELGTPPALQNEDHMRDDHPQADDDVNADQQIQLE